MLNRTIGEMNLSVNESMGDIPSVRVRLDKNDSESHIVMFLTGEWQCDCQGFMSHGHCRHMDAVKVLKNAVDQAMPLALQVLNASKKR